MGMAPPAASARPKWNLCRPEANEEFHAKHCQKQKSVLLISCSANEGRLLIHERQPTGKEFATISTNPETSPKTLFESAVTH
jgi:hypothetical protein